MRLFNSPRCTRCLEVSRMALMVFVTLASFQLAAQAQRKERPMEHPTLYRTTQMDGLSICKDVPNAQVHILDAGHFALDTAADEISALARGFVHAIP